LPLTYGIFRLKCYSQAKRGQDFAKYDGKESGNESPPVGRGHPDGMGTVAA